MPIRSISVFKVQQGRRDEFIELFESLVAQHMAIVHAASCSAATLYTVVDDPDNAVEIADWESADARHAAQTKEGRSVFAPLFELVAAPPSATLLEPLRRRHARQNCRSTCRGSGISAFRQRAFA
jgi:quinol monooxygenase YgiN